MHTSVTRGQKCTTRHSMDTATHDMVRPGEHALCRCQFSDHTMRQCIKCVYRSPGSLVALYETPYSAADAVVLNSACCSRVSRLKSSTRSVPMSVLLCVRCVELSHAADAAAVVAISPRW